MVVIIHGPLGIGKTTTSWNLLYRFERAVLLEGDYIAAIQPFDYYNQAHLDYAYRTIGMIAAYHAANGIPNLIINWVLESPEQLDRLKQQLAALELPIVSYRLWCDPAVIAERIRQRNQPDLAFELDRSRELVAILDRAAETGDMGIRIDTTALTADQTAARIWADISSWARNKVIPGVRAGEMPTI